MLKAPRRSPPSAPTDPTPGLRGFTPYPEVFAYVNRRTDAKRMKKIPCQEHHMRTTGMLGIRPDR
jgi:hypothetical protein